MTDLAVDPLSTVQSFGEALLIGLLIGVQRESIEGVHPGLRDFLMIAVAGAVCGVLEQPWLTATALAGITFLLAVYHFELREKRTGITTELTGVATFCITYMTALPHFPSAAPMAIGLAIAMTAFLEFKKRLQSFFRETITEHEFNDTLAFLAVVLVIYPLLPAGRYGPYDFFAPRQIWFYVILISSISYAGYFFQKFLGADRGLDLTAVLGGLASTLATTLNLARSSKHEPQNGAAYARAAVMANSVQFPRTLFIMFAVNDGMARRGALALLACLMVGVVISWLFSRWVPKVTEHELTSGNPFRVRPALTFGALFAAVVFLNRAANAEFGSAGLYVTSALGGLVDPGTVIVSASDMLNHGKVTVEPAVGYVLVALGANVLFKCAVALIAGSKSFAIRVIVSLAVMFGSGIGLWLMFG